MAEIATGPQTPVRRQFRQFFRHEFSTIRYVRWGRRNAPRRAVLVHGFMQNGREHDPFAAALAAAGWCVYCPDLPGHGWSDRRRRHEDYDYLLYAHTVGTMLAIAGGDGVDLFGNSMGAVIVMLMASARRPPLRTLILNDGSVRWPDAAVCWFAEAAPASDRFPDRDEAVRQVTALLRQRGPLDEAGWRQVLAYSLSRRDGEWRGRFDPRLKWSMDSLERDQPDHWWHWQRIAVPTLLVRGERSTMLTEETAAEMIARQPRAQLLTMPEAGHSPWLRRPEQIEPVVDWLRRH
ncbi:alpha/beta fold hydrolase [Stella sp.]|uniref:alpha/beta fold hydrolase n=1 Tax=Stella sp. TaxID=2912054 RepID=UPI0035AFD14C